MKNYNQLAETLDTASRTATPITQISHTQDINLEEAYAIQSISMSRRYIRGEKLVGLKLGFTSKAKMEQMGVHDMIWGRLTDEMKIKGGGLLRMFHFIHPRAEPEIAFLVSREIDKEVPLEKVGDFIKGIAVAVEIIDSRYKDFKFSLEDVVADNCSSAAFAIGEWKDPNENIQGIKMTLKVDGQVVQSGNSDAILGNPLESFVAAVRLALANGEILKEGSIVLAGAATPAVYIQTGQLIEATAEGLGIVSLNVV